MNTAAFWDRVAAYNEATWPVQALMVAAAVYLTARTFARPGPRTDVWLKAFLALAFAWDGIVFFVIFVQNPVSIFTGTLFFIVVAVLLVVDIFARKTRFRLPTGKWMRGLTIAWLLLALLYPAIGWLLGHRYPAVLLPLFPCPLTVWAIALVAAAAPQVDKKVYIALLPWALMGLPKCFGALDCYEDCILFASGAYGLVVLIVNWRLIGRQSQDLTPHTLGL